MKGPNPGEEEEGETLEVDYTPDGSLDGDEGGGGGYGHPREDDDDEDQDSDQSL